MDALKEKLLSIDFARVRQHSKFQKAGVQTKNGSIFTWTLAIPGGKGTSWEGLVYDVEISFSRRHPFEPPRVDFPRTRRNTSNPGHPLVDGSGRLRMQKLSFDKWLPTIEADTVIGWLYHLFETEPPSVTSGHGCPFSHLSSETVLQVLSFLDAGDLGRLSQTGKHMLTMCFDEATWAKLYYRSCTSLDGLLGDKEGGACPVRVMGVSGKWYWEGAREAYIRSWEMRKACKGQAFATSRTQELHTKWELSGLMTVSAALMSDIQSRRLNVPIAAVNHAQIRHMEYLLDSQTMKVASLQRLRSWPAVCRTMLVEKESERSVRSDAALGAARDRARHGLRRGVHERVAGAGVSRGGPGISRPSEASSRWSSSSSPSSSPSSLSPLSSLGRTDVANGEVSGRGDRFTVDQRIALGLLCGNLAAFPPIMPRPPPLRVSGSGEGAIVSPESNADAIAACPHHHYLARVPFSMHDRMTRVELPSRTSWRAVVPDDGVGDNDDRDVPGNNAEGLGSAPAAVGNSAPYTSARDNAVTDGIGATLLNPQPSCDTGGVYWPTLYDITMAKLRQKDRLRECFRRFTVGQKLDVRDPSGVWMGAVVLWAPKRCGGASSWEHTPGGGDGGAGMGAAAAGGPNAGEGPVPAPAFPLFEHVTGAPDAGSPEWRRMLRLALLADGGHHGRAHLNQRLSASGHRGGPAAVSVHNRGASEAACGLPNVGEWVVCGSSDAAQGFLTSATSVAADLHQTPSEGRPTDTEWAPPPPQPPPPVPPGVQSGMVPGHQAADAVAAAAASTGDGVAAHMGRPGKSVLIHYEGHKSRYDEWITAQSPRLAPFRSRTSRPLSLTMQSVARVVLGASVGRTSEGTPAPDCVEVSLSCPWISHCAGGGVVTYRLPTTTVLGAVLADFCHLGGISLRRAVIFRARMNLAADIRNGSCEVEELDDQRTLDYYRVGSGAVLHVVVAPAVDDLRAPCPSCKPLVPPDRWDDELGRRRRLGWTGMKGKYRDWLRGKGGAASSSSSSSPAPSGGEDHGGARGDGGGRSEMEGDEIGSEGDDPDDSSEGLLPGDHSRMNGLSSDAADMMDVSERSGGGDES